MLYRRFSIVTCFIALLGILLSNVIESTRDSSSGFAVGQRLQDWQNHDRKLECNRDARLCVESVGPYNFGQKTA